LNLGWDTEYCEVFRDFPQSLYGNYGIRDNTGNELFYPRSKSLFTLIQTFGTMSSELLTASLSKGQIQNGKVYSVAVKAFLPPRFSECS
jgi:hypothetical protein